MKKSAVEIYALAVCFVALVCAAIALGTGIYDLIRVSAPGFTMSAWQYERHQSNEAFRDFLDRGRWEQDRPQLTDRELTERRLASFELQRNTERRTAIQSLTVVLIVLLIDLVVYLAHWRLAATFRSVPTT